MSIFPPAHAPLRLQARSIREVLVEDHAAATTSFGSALFKPRTVCLRGHPVFFETAPHRLSCAECRAPFAGRAYCCRRCGGRDWHCGRCVVFSTHPMRRAADDGAPTLTGGGPDGKLRYVRLPLALRRTAVQSDAERALDRVETVLDEFSIDPWGGGHGPSGAAKLPRKFLPATPRSFFRPFDAVEAARLGMDPPRPLEARRAALRADAAAIKGPAEAALAARKERHREMLLVLLRRTAGSDIDSEGDHSSMSEADNEADGNKGGAAAASGKVDEMEEEEEEEPLGSDDESSVSDDDEPGAGMGSDDESGNGSDKGD